MNILIDKILEYDHRILDLIIRGEKPPVRKFLSFITHFGDGAFWVFCYILFYIFGEGNLRNILPVIIFAELIGLLIIIILRNLTKRERPAPFKYFLHWNKYSFPSAHTVRVFIITTVFGVKYLSWLPLLLTVASIISFSRIYLKKHYPLDVFFGMVIGISCAVISLIFGTF